MGSTGDALIASTLAWWHEAGVDTLVDEKPRDWLKQRGPISPKLPAETLPAPASPPPETLPGTLEAFVAWRMTGGDQPEGIGSAAKAAPFGSTASGLMIMVDRPSGEELFGDDEGRLFDRMLAAIGRDRESVYVAPVSFADWLVTPTPQTVARIGELARHHVRLAAPRRVLAMGDAASRALTGLIVSDARQSLRAVNQGGGNAVVVATWHPRTLLTQPAMKAESWADLLLLTGGLS